MRRQPQRAASSKPINYKSWSERGIRLPPQAQSTINTSSIQSDDSESDDNPEISILEKTINLYQSLYESDHNTSSGSTDTNLSSLVQGLTLNEPTTMEKEYKQLAVEQDVISSEIVDFGDDYDIESMTFDELEQSHQKLISMRNQFKRIHSELHQIIDNEETYEKTFFKSNNVTIQKARDVLNRINARRKEVRSENQSKLKQSSTSNKSVSTFLMHEAKGIIKSLYTVFKEEPDKFDFDELVLADRNTSTHLQSMNTLSKHMEKILNCNQFDQTEITEITTSYNELFALKSTFNTKLQSAMKEQEISKEQKFQSTKLNIKLSKFKGYDSSSDIYTFQTDFEKLHLRTTPSAHLPDLIKNNYLDGPALNLVKGVDNIKEIWSRLKSSYGDPQLLLTKKIATLNQTTRLWRIRGDPEKQIETLSKMLNFMRDVMKLARQHKIENHLFYGKTLEDIYQLMDDVRQTKWFSLLEGKQLDQPDIWEEFTKFLEKEISIQQLKLLHCQSTTTDAGRPPPSGNTRQPPGGGRRSSHYTDNKGPINQTKCFVCDETGHVQTNGPNGSKLIQYFSCPEFVKMKPSQRFSTLRSKGYCTQCLFPGAQQSKGKHQDGRCQREFLCPHPSHDNFDVKKHVLICQDHSSTPESHQVLQNFKERCILRQTKLQQFSKDIKLVFHVNIQSHVSSKSKIVQQQQQDEDDDNNDAIYILQTINVDGQRFTIFFDSGCSDMVISEKAIKRLGKRAKMEYSGDIPIGGVGNVQTISSGSYKVNIPLHDGRDALLKGVCLPNITATFPTYKLKQVEDDIIGAYQQTGGNPKDLPSLPLSVGGEIDIMLGIRYQRYYPKEAFQLKTGLTLFKSVFKNIDGSRGVVGGPHRAFNIINEHHNFLAINQMKSFITTHRQLSSQQLTTQPDVDLIHLKINKDHQQNLMMEIGDHPSALVARNQKIFEQVENAGSQITYRCVHCRDCKECKISESIESISLKEEVEQYLINKSVSVDIKNRLSTASLPLLHNPEIKLAHNKHKALKVYFQQLRKLDKEPADKADVIASEKKLQSMGYVDYVENLTTQQQQMLANNNIINYIPWRAVWKPNSLSTPCRIVFDASQPTDSGFSLNDILAKGTNNMNRLVEILIRWSLHSTAFHTDIRKMYNSVRLREHHWCLQRYIWEDQLDRKRIPKEKVIKTLIYGVKSSGNQSERALRETGRLSSADYPEVANIIMKDIYVDDCLSGEKSKELATQRADELEIVVNRGGFSLKGVTFSHQKPKADLTTDGESISVAGMKWYPEEDCLSLDVGELNFAKKVRGKKPTKINQPPSQLTRRHCVSKVSELYDLSGKITPLTASMKLDLHDLVDLGLGWDDRIPDNLRPIWESHFKMMEEISQIKYKRAIVPADAINLDINSIDAGDASKNIACVAIYARFKRKCGKFSCQLVFARSRLIPDGTTQPRGELSAATLNAHTGEVVRRAFGPYLKSSIKLTDSQIALFWINGVEKQLKPWVRSRVTEIHRFTDLDSWRFVTTDNMIADIGTRRGTTLSDVSASSDWFNGFEWMREPEEVFPTKSVNQVKLSNEEIKIAKKEQIIPAIDPTTIKTGDQVYSIHISSINQRFEFAQYRVNPMKYGWTRALKIMSKAYQFISYFKCLKFKSIISQPSDKAALHYFFFKATEEVQAFSSKKKYEKISTMKDGILYYTGRILPNNKITPTGRFTNVMLDLSTSSFFVPLVDRYSPIAYSIVNHVHWNHPVAKHAGVETVFRYVLQIVFIIDGRDLIKLVRKRCERCRYIAKQTINVEMGPISNHNLNIAPPFYSTQVDLCGPFTAFSNFHKRTTVKIWMVIFCCTTTSATKIKIMDDYSSSAFILSFTRLASEVGYPKYLLPDEGSQLVKGCSTLRLSFKDIQHRLFQDVLVNFETCPVSGHHMHGKVERKIQEIKKSLSINFDGYKFSILQWETVACEISNTINDAPLALNGHTDFEIADVITPNRLLMGRNNDRSPTFPVNISSKPDKFMKQNEDLFNSWFEVWLTVHVPKLMYRPKWYDNSFDLKVGDIVLFTKQDSPLCNTYQYGKIKSVETSKDGRIRSVQVEYRNHSEKVNRTTYRATRGLVMIHPVDELNLFEELLYTDI